MPGGSAPGQRSCSPPLSAVAPWAWQAPCVARPPWLTPTGVARAVHPGVRRVSAGVGPLAHRWSELVEEASRADGPLYVALGDSTVLGAGASSVETTAIAQVWNHLRAVTGEPWRCVNLGRYGVKLAAVIETQLPRLHDWGQPALVTVGAGSNDVVWSRGLAPLLAGLERLLDALPAGAVVGTLPPGWVGKGLHANEWLRIEAAARSLRVAEVGVFPRPRRMVAGDGLHPNDAGYRYIAEGIIASLEQGPTGPRGLQLPSLG